eukprot:Skav222617  [mRNA]  locus=scaffold3821:48851:54669:- [translate_table: standard]
MALAALANHVSVTAFPRNPSAPSRRSQRSAPVAGAARTGAVAAAVSLAALGRSARAAKAKAAPAEEREAVATYLQQRSESNGEGKRKAAGETSAPPVNRGPKLFTPMTRRCLTTAQEEQQRLGHDGVQPAHLLLALLKETVGGWWV